MLIYYVEHKAVNMNRRVHKKRRLSSSDSSESNEDEHRRNFSESRDYKRHRHKTSSSKRVPQKEYGQTKDLEILSQNKEFSFQNYRYELNKILLRDEELIPDPDDFWKFLKNYETVQKRAAGRKSVSNTGKCLLVGHGSLVVTCSPRDPRFAGSNLTEVDGFFSECKNPEHKSSRRDFKLGVPSLRFQACSRTSSLKK